MQVAAGPANGNIEDEGQRQINQRRAFSRSSLSPVEARVRQENGEATQDKHDETDGVNPMGEAYEGAMPRHTQSLGLLDRYGLYLSKFRHERHHTLAATIAHKRYKHDEIQD